VSSHVAAGALAAAVGGAGPLVNAGYAVVMMKLAVGDAVVYALHGVGRVVAREQKLIMGVEHESVVLDLAGGLRVTLSLEQAHTRLRAVAK
jgi:RNA polymerase-interacting CarD/CdnL/TRCF family regulator